MASDGSRIHLVPELVEAMKRTERKLVREQRNLSGKYRKGPKSRNDRNQKLRVSRAHERVSNMPLDFHPRLQKGSWQEGNLSLSSFAASEARGRVSRVYT
ncbi:MAG: hypothetical protein VST70_05935 [Nitrospirota bacterium]|nr:hypothetical protein [Nitrospirota bacterium]